MLNTIYLRKENLVTKVKNIEISPTSSNLFAVESEMTTRTMPINQFKAENERIS